MSAKDNDALGLILAGGQATRLGGGAKGAVLLKGRPLVAYVAERLKVTTSCIAINTVPSLTDFYDGMGFPVVLDGPIFFGRGPLVGLLAGLEWARDQGAARLLSAPCDAPFLPSNMGRRLLDEIEGPYDAAICVTAEGAHPLCAAWSTALAGNLYEHLSDPTSKLAVKAFLSKVRVARVLFTDETDFLNINTPEDLRNAGMRLA